MNGEAVIGYWKSISVPGTVLGITQETESRLVTHVTFSTEFGLVDVSFPLGRIDFEYLEQSEIWSLTFHEGMSRIDIEPESDPADG